MVKGLNKIMDQFPKDNLARHGVTLELIEVAIQRLKLNINMFESRKKASSSMNAGQIRALNDQLMLFERIFLLPQGLPGRPSTKHAIFAPAKTNAYGSNAFPGLTDLLADFGDLTGDEMSQRVKELKRHTSDLMIIINNAADFLEPLEII